MSNWFIACGDESCDCCGTPAAPGADMVFRPRTGKTICEPCVDREDDEIGGMCDALDEARYA